VAAALRAVFVDTLTNENEEPLLALGHEETSFTRWPVSCTKGMHRPLCRHSPRLVGANIAKAAVHAAQVPSPSDALTGAGAIPDSTVTCAGAACVLESRTACAPWCTILTLRDRVTSRVSDLE
jgi:hypothetical protein